MQRKLSPSVKISYFDKEVIWNSLKKFTQQLKKNTLRLKESSFLALLFEMTACREVM